MPISIGAMFFAFAFTAVVAQIHQKLRTPSWLVGVLTPVFVVAFVLTAKAMPFVGIASEIPLVILATLSGSGPITFMMRGNIELQAAREAKKVEFKTEGTPGMRNLNGQVIAAMALFLPVMAVTMGTLVTRLNYASWLRWECDGRILEVTRDAGNHQAPMLFVETDGKTDRFSQVEPELWSQAKPGMRLKKAARSPMAWLDGRKVRMVPEQMKFWNDSK